MRYYQDNLLNELIVDNFAGGGVVTLIVKVIAGFYD